jgi:hypothetical protein
MVDMNQLSGLAQLSSSLMSNPLYRASIEQSRYESYKKKLDAYHAKEFALTHEQIDKVIRSIKSGRNTYQDIQNVLPSMNSPTLCSYLVDDFKKDPNAPESPLSPISLLQDSFPKHYFQLVQVPEDFYPLYEFKPTDAFALSVLGENRWYEIREADKNRYLNYVSIVLSAVAAIASVISVLR